MNSVKTALISDFDNTLYDWFEMWHASFSAMLNELVRVSEIPEDVLLPAIRKVHQKFGTSEYAFLIENLPPLRDKFPNENLNKYFDSAIHAYRSARKSNLKLYEGVLETLVYLRSRGVLIVLYTDSRAFYTVDRVRRLGLDDLVDFIFSPPDHDVPGDVTSHVHREEYRLTHAKHHYLPEGVSKPNPEVLLDILKDIGRTPDSAVYLGDSLMRDVAMAQDAGVTDVFAKYGVVQDHPGYELLRKASHWPDVAVEKEKVTSVRTVFPTHTIFNFGEIKSLFRG